MRRRLLSENDMNTIAGNFNSIQTFMDGSAAIMSDLQTRMSTTEGSVSGHGTSVSSLGTRMTAAESGLTSQASRITALESGAGIFNTWKGAKIAAMARMPGSSNLPTVAVLGLLSTVTKAGLDTALEGIYAKLNQHDDMFRTRLLTA